MHPVRRLFYLSLVNSIAFIIGSQVAHSWLNPMNDYKEFILKAEAEYQARQQELRDVEDYLKQKRERHLKQIS
jgi:predicted LPLAT superfamily acyltransferase